MVHSEKGSCAATVAGISGGHCSAVFRHLAVSEGATCIVSQDWEAAFDGEAFRVDFGRPC